MRVEFSTTKTRSRYWSDEEDNFIYEELKRQPHKLPHEIAAYLYGHPLYKHRSFGGLYQHVGYLRAKARSNRISE